LISAAQRIEETSAWGSRLGVVAASTDRATGSLGFWTGEPVGEVMRRWRELRHGLAPRFAALVMAHQVHGARVLWHEGVVPGWHITDGADGHVTRQRGVMLAVTVADCVPIYLAGSDATVVALLHAGWRGVAAGMLEAGVAAITERTGVRPSALAAHCGVAICEQCYEVGAEVIAAVLGRQAAGPERLDLRGALAARARALGISDVSTSPWCTSCHRDRYFSHRGSRGADAGRQAGLLGVPLG
jgi:YfiH family protein